MFRIMTQSVSNEPRLKRGGRAIWIDCREGKDNSYVLDDVGRMHNTANKHWHQKMNAGTKK
jgi:hypothetical protein